MKWLIVTADDFGMSAGINRGIVEAHREGILTSTSLLVDRPASEEATALGRACPTLSIGLHLELSPNAAERIAAEVDAQLTRFIALVGGPPTHVDSHHDSHRDPRVLPHLLTWARDTGVPVRGYCGVRHLAQFYGQWGGETHVEQIAVGGLLRLLDDHVREGVTELTCHPGYAEPGLGSSYAAEREVEVRTLCDPRVRQAIHEKGIRLIGFADLSALATCCS
jgi:predicted glycoside hydrolase/deacetylase ChbG (UPF0249 family)